MCKVSLKKKSVKLVIEIVIISLKLFFRFCICMVKRDQHSLPLSKVGQGMPTRIVGLNKINSPINLFKKSKIK